LGMPRVTVHDRIRRLQERGVVRRLVGACMPSS
jgi:DNA-binding Lrp family transcriptional regulator